MKQIFHESHQLSDLQSLCIDHVCCCQIDTQSGQIHQKEKDRFCGRHQLEQILRLFHEVAVFTVKAFGFVAIIVKRANHTDSGEIFTEDAIDTIQRILLSVTERSRYFSYDTTPRMITGTVDAMIKERFKEERIVRVKLTMIMIGVKSAVRKITFKNVMI